MLRWSFSAVRAMRENFKTSFAFEQWNESQSWNKELEKTLF
jgi:hypothetical protein